MLSAQPNFENKKLWCSTSKINLEDEKQPTDFGPLRKQKRSLHFHTTSV